MQGEVIVYCWDRDLEFWTDDFSVGHVAAAIVHPGAPFELVLSQYPKPSGLVGSNTFFELWGYHQARDNAEPPAQWVA